MAMHRSGGQLHGHVWPVLAFRLASCAQACLVLFNHGHREGSYCVVNLRVDGRMSHLKWLDAVEFCKRNKGWVKLERGISQRCKHSLATPPNCDVKCYFFNCPNNTYGPPSCLSACQCLLGETCDLITGQCHLDRCLPGYFGPPACLKRCHCFKHTACHSTTGICMMGCQMGYRGLSCQERECPAGYFRPPACRDKCHCRDHGDCDVTTGTCSRGCAKGRQGLTCNETACDPARDPKCKLCSCSDPNCYAPVRCKNKASECREGWYGNNCTSRRCPVGKYGPPQCTGQCFCLENRFCHPTDGDCQGTTCVPGRIGPHCEHKNCSATFFGPPKCTSRCFCQGRASCDIYTGKCAHGCVTGWRGDQCNQRLCPEGTYGFPKCTRRCHCTDQSACHSFTGLCLVGSCQVGWAGQFCAISLHSLGHNAHVQPWQVMGSVVTLVILAMVAIVAMQCSMPSWRLMQRRGAVVTTDIVSSSFYCEERTTSRGDQTPNDDWLTAGITASGRNLHTLMTSSPV